MHFNARLPPSRRLEKYQPESYITEKKARASEPAPALRRPSHVNEYEELLADSAEVRAEVSDDLSLGTINSRPDRRGPEATVVSYTGAPANTGTTKDASEEPEPDLIAKWGKKKAKKIAGDAYAVEDGVMYDMSFERSLFKTVTKPWWICFWLLFADCES
jgi:hypothetical protein